MSTLSDLKARIADDLDRSDLSSQIAAAVRDAIEYYESERFSFNEVHSQTGTFSTSVDAIPLTSLPFYPLKIDRIRAQYSGSTNLTDLWPVNYEALLESQDAKAVCRPLEFCVYAEKLLLDSLPDDDYTFVMDGVKRLASGSTNSYAADSSVAWFNEAEPLIRARVKADLYTNLLKDEKQAAIQNGVEAREFRRLKQKMNTRNSGRFTPTTF